jgi:hydrogenase maturation protease
MMKITLLGLGNILMRDDGVGVHAVKAVQERFEVPPELDIVDGGTAGLDLLPFLEGRDRVLFVDAVDFGQEPGFIGELVNDAIPAFFGKDKGSLHHIELTDVLATARLLNIVPEEICLIGIQPQAIELGLELTDVMQGKLDLLVSCIADKLRDWGVRLVPCSPDPPPY